MTDASPPLPPDLVEVARMELNETPEVVAGAMLDMKRRLELLPAAEQPHRLDTEYLTFFLRPSKWRVDIAYKKILETAKFRKQHSHLLDRLNGENFR